MPSRAARANRPFFVRSTLSAVQICVFHVPDLERRRRDASEARSSRGKSRPRRDFSRPISSPCLDNGLLFRPIGNLNRRRSRRDRRTFLSDWTVEMRAMRFWHLFGREEVEWRRNYFFLRAAGKVDWFNERRALRKLFLCET